MITTYVIALAVSLARMRKTLHVYTIKNPMLQMYSHFLASKNLLGTMVQRVNPAPNVSVCQDSTAILNTGNITNPVTVFCQGST